LKDCTILKKSSCFINIFADNLRLIGVKMCAPKSCLYSFRITLVVICKGTLISFLLQIPCSLHVVVIQSNSYLSGNPDSNLESQCARSHVIYLKSDSKLLSGFREKFMKYPVIFVYSKHYANTRIY
jgi:hypothetical protein